MDLRAWITAERRTQDDVADAVGISRAQISRIVRGASQPSTEVVEGILRLTGGAVGLEDLHRVRVRYLVSTGRLRLDPFPLSAPSQTDARAAA
jgi:transcriptional regulator with XRE-family HTH domain